MKKRTHLSRRNFIGNSAKAITLATAVGNLPLALFRKGHFPAQKPADEYLKTLYGVEIDPEAARKAYSELTVDAPAEKVYKYFNDFCLTHFGAEIDPITYETFGSELEIQGDSQWSYYSERSAVLAWSTSLPARSFVEYGATDSYGSRTDISERYYYTHLHYLKGLDPDTTYHYRYVSVDERGNRIESADQTFQTRRIREAIHVPGNMGKPPYILNKPNATYLITEDINAPGTAFNLEADNITIDLGGNKVTHGNEKISNLDYENLSTSGVGIRKVGGRKHSGLTVLNGVLAQGEAENNLDYYQAENMVRPGEERGEKLQKNMNRGFSNIELEEYNHVEIAGVTSEYRWHQTWGVYFEGALGEYNIHHNVFLDKGTQMFSRHGAGGARSLGFRYSGNDQNNRQIHHNLIKRTRQNGFNGARQIHDNEIYVDSWVVNSFAISPFNVDCEVKRNKIFLTGYYGCGVLWADRGLIVSDNYLHMESINTMIEPPDQGRRLIETWGEQDVLIGMRLTNYSGGGQPREDFYYDNNVILGRSRGDVIMRGVALYSDHSVKNFVLNNNKIKIYSQDNIVEKAACVVTQGSNNDRSKHLPLYYKNTVLESNICNIRYGDVYGRGSNHQFFNCKIIKTGNNVNYHTFVFDGGASVFNHVLRDCEFIGGAAYNDVYWNNTQSKSNYRIDWTLAVETAPDADVIVNDRKGENAFSGKSGPSGKIEMVLTESIIRPVEWKLGSEETEVEEKYNHQEERFSPYTVTIKKNGEQSSKVIELTKKSTITV